MNEPQWLLTEAILQGHDEQIAEHGGLVGMRDENLLLSALARPQNLWAYGEPAPDLAALAAAYGFGIARNHPFADGNKRTALLATEGFLLLNGYQIDATQDDVYNTFNDTAAGKISETDLANWIRSHLTPATLDEEP